MTSSDEVSPDVRKFSGTCMACDNDYRHIEVGLEICQHMEVRALADDF